MLASWANNLPVAIATLEASPQQTAARLDPGTASNSANTPSPATPDTAALKDIKIPTRTAD